MNPPSPHKRKDSKQDVATPQWMVDLFQQSDMFDCFGIDLAADASNTKCDKLITEQENSLVQPWHTLTSAKNPGWCNPPYANVREWVSKAYYAALKGATVFMLIPAALHRNYSIDFLKYGPCSIVLLAPAIKFDGYPNASSIMHMLIVFDYKLKGDIYWGNMRDSGEFTNIIDKIFLNMGGPFV